MALSAPYQGLQLKFELLQQALRKELLTSCCRPPRHVDHYTPGHYTLPSVKTPHGGNGEMLGDWQTEGGQVLEEFASLSSYIASFGIVRHMSVDTELPYDDVSTGGTLKSERYEDAALKRRALGKRKRRRGSTFTFRPLSDEERASWFDQQICKDMDHDVDCRACNAPHATLASSAGELWNSSLDEDSCDHGFVPLPSPVETFLEGTQSVACHEADFYVGGPFQPEGADPDPEADVGSEGELELEESSESEEELLPDGRVYDLPVVLTTVKARLHAKEARNQGPPPTRRREGKYGWR